MDIGMVVDVDELVHAFGGLCRAYFTNLMSCASPRDCVHFHLFMLLIPYVIYRNVWWNLF